MPSKEEQLNPSSDGAFSFSFHSCSPRKLLLIHLISSYPPAQDMGSAASTFQSNFHVHSSRHFLLPGTLWPIPSQSPGCPGMLCPVLSSRDSPQHSSLPKPAQPSTSSPGAAHQIPNGNLLAPSAMFPIIPSPMGHPKGVIKPLQKSPGDPPALPWVCCPEGTQPSAHPWSWISSGGSIPQEQQLCRPGGAQRAKISTEEPNVPQFRVLQDFGWLWLGAGSVQFFPLSQFLPRLHSLIPKIQNEQGRPRGLRHLNTPQMCCFINPGVAEGLEAAGRD